LIRTPQIRSVAEDGAELILNNTDTQNILDAVRNMREVVRMRMSSMNTDIAKQTEGNAQKTVINKDIQQVDQTVSIDATFPNVSVAAEIEEALNNLINQAVQYATRDNR
jgi:histone H3/H4